MKKILISDAGENSARVAYIYNALSQSLPAALVRPEILVGQSRSALVVEEQNITPEISRTVQKIVTEVTAIGCKYGYLSRRLQLKKLTLRERKIFICALIAADLSADEKYIRARLQTFESCALDGFFNFRLAPLKRKWDKIIGYIPPDFSAAEMDRFMNYLVDGNKGRAYIRADEVYDGKYRLCRRGELVGASDELRVETEILLSGAGEVLVSHPLAEESELFLRKYYGAHAVFYGNF